MASSTDRHDDGYYEAIVDAVDVIAEEIERYFRAESVIRSTGTDLTRRIAQEILDRLRLSLVQKARQVHGEVRYGSAELRWIRRRYSSK